jgi:hypothetical protein
MTEQLTLFDYGELDSETRIVVQQEDKEFDENMQASGNAFIRACKNLYRIHKALKYKRPGFDEYCKGKPGLSRATAYKMLDIGKMCLESGHIPQLESREVLYLLASPSTPEAAKEEIRQRNIDSHQEACNIVNKHKSDPVNLEPIAATRNGAGQVAPILVEDDESDWLGEDWDEHSIIPI